MIRLNYMAPFTLVLLLAQTGIALAQGISAPLPTATEPIIFNPATPPNTGRPGRRSDAGSRGCGEGESAGTAIARPLVALVPVARGANATVVFGKTTADRPTFWFYVPYRAPAIATFVLQDQTGVTVHEANLPLTANPGIISLTLPQTVTPLATGQRYQWFLKLYCRAASPPAAFVDGWIQQERLTADLTQKLKTATLRQQVRLYAANGFWFDALMLAAKLRQTNPNDSAWGELLTGIGLESVATAAIASP